MREYKNLKVLKIIPGAQLDCELRSPIPCTNEYFVNRFWMPIKRQINKKLVFALQPDMRTFSLIYNQIALGFDSDVVDTKRIKLIKEDAEKVFEIALTRIDNIVEHIYCKERTGDVIPFIDELRPITSIEGNTITLNGRLPMQEDFFIREYWNSIRNRHHEECRGIRFRLHFSDLGTKISVSAELCRYNASCARSGAAPRQDAANGANYQIQVILCDISEAIADAAFTYAESCREQSSKHPK